MPLSVINVLTALQTGMVNGVYISPLAILALQWFTKVQYMMEFPMTDAAGAVLITKKQFDKLPPDYQKILLTNAKKYLGKLTALSREENSKAIETLKQNGITVIPAPKNISVFKQKGKKARRLMAGKLYPLQLVKDVEKALEEYRTSKKTVR